MATDDFAERLEDDLASPCPCGSGLSSLLCKRDACDEEEWRRTLEDIAEIDEKRTR